VENAPALDYVQQRSAFIKDGAFQFSFQVGGSEAELGETTYVERNHRGIIRKAEMTL
jgi:hypothetical protein